ncbi:MAG TPA: hypothetical protein VFF91_13815 [Pseudoxanthomonas sp.]|nr:hypothetical protein [Pseudoxanthomonas sp.]
MHWLYLIFAFGALLVAITTTQGWVLALALLAALALFVAWARGWYLDKTGGGRDEMAMIDPDELRRLRELAEARRRQAAAPPPAKGDQAPPAA